ncbi:cytochrome-c peroxidase [Flavobacterium sediminis]|uniref:Cytochrome-c peroxidase n=1 Tax=Flavobacterium sediminis TaxID=2201181 RepID=A0A2U8QWV7_9FLAO|nr:cytochrome c peroxidase [Flavobacterium sediminis]AWM14275.1 cytochrome-c peroxidase [Flavobacterium sediminis]
MKKVFALIAGLFAISCSSDSEAEYQNIPINYQAPSNFPPMAYDLTNNPLTEKGFELGKKIFYDGRLSSDGTISCGFCHIQENGFTHHGHNFSHGVGEAIGRRNAPAVQNMAYQTLFMWDGATEHIEMMPMIPILSEIEMNGNFVDIITMMQNDSDYQKLFKQAFEDGAINSENMLKALAQFMTMLTSSNSRFDKYRRNESGGDLTVDELEGYDLFNQKCASCHATDLFTDNSLRNNGLPINPAINDLGHYDITEQEVDKYKFKVPSLRNIEVTAPYMHDGRFYTLEAVLNHYQNGIVNTENLDPALSDNGSLGIPLTEDEKVKIIAFLKTLTDNEFLTDSRFSEF